MTSPCWSRRWPRPPAPRRRPRARADASAPARRKRRAALIQTELGAFSIHAGTSVAAGDRAGLERLLRYAGRGPLSTQRLSRTETGKVRYRLRKPYHTGQTELVLEPVAFLKRLAALVPPKRQNQIRDYGLVAAQAHDRDRLVALVAHDGGDGIAGAGQDGRDGADPSDAADPPASPPAGAGYRVRWAHLLARVFEHDVLRCDHSAPAAP